MRQRVACLLVLGLAVLGSALTLAPIAAAEKIALGIAPVYDGGGAAFGTAVSQHLTLFTYQELLNSPVVKPALLSPGGVYSPLDPSWIVDYVQDRKDISLLLLGVLKPAAGAGGHSTIAVDYTLIDARSGESLSAWNVSVEINARKTALDSGRIEGVTVNGYGQLERTYMVAPSRTFEKQPLGKATAHLASLGRESLEGKLLSLGKVNASHQDIPVSSATSNADCPVHVHITYGYKHSASHSYQLLANGLDQSTNIVDGVATFSAPEGELLLQFSVNDSPYKMQKEPLYQLNVTHSCSVGSLIVDIGQGGDAHPKWE